jgi:hypothetical protein
MVVLLVVDSNRTAALEHRAVRRHPVGNAREQLGQVKRRIGVMTDAEKKHLPVQIVYPTDRAFRDVRRKREWVGGDSSSFGAGRGEGVEMIASQYTWQAPERIRNHA